MESTCNKYIMLINYFCHSVMRPFHALEISGMIRSWGGYQCYCTRYLLGVLYEGKFISNDISRYIHGGLTCMLEGSDHWPPPSRPERTTSTQPWTPWAGEDNIDNLASDHWRLGASSQCRLATLVAKKYQNMTSSNFNIFFQFHIYMNRHLFSQY